MIQFQLMVFNYQNSHISRIRRFGKIKSSLKLCLDAKRNKRKENKIKRRENEKKYVFFFTFYYLVKKKSERKENVIV